MRLQEQKNYTVVLSCPYFYFTVKAEITSHLRRVRSDSQLQASGG